MPFSPDGELSAVHWKGSHTAEPVPPASGGRRQRRGRILPRDETEPQSSSRKLYASWARFLTVVRPVSHCWTTGKSAAKAARSLAANDSTKRDFVSGRTPGERR